MNNKDEHSSEKAFAKFLQRLYATAYVIKLKKEDKFATKLKFEELFKEDTTDFLGDCYFDPPHKIIVK